MIVEDDLHILRLLEDILRSDGFQAVGVARPDEALEVATRHRPAVILIDIMLPRSSGIEVAERLQAHGFAQTPMVALSASTIMRELAMHTGLFAASVAKPFDIDRLCELVRSHVGTCPDGGVGRMRT